MVMAVTSYWLLTTGSVGLIRTIPEKFEHGNFTLKMHQLFYVHTTLEQSPAILELCFEKLGHELIVFTEKASFLKCFPFTLTTKSRHFQIPLV